MTLTWHNSLITVIMKQFTLNSLKFKFKILIGAYKLVTGYWLLQYKINDVYQRDP